MRAAYLAVQELEDADESDDAGPVWHDAKVAEMKSLVLEHDVWETESLPSGRTAISTKWVVKRKEVPTPRLKARFTPRGFSQLPGVDYQETFAPVAKLVTLRIFLSLVSILSLCTWQLDLKTAFLNADLEEEIYCQPVYDHFYILKSLFNVITDPSGKSRIAKQLRDLRRGCVLRMKKACYGLKQAPRAWWKKLHQWLLDNGFVPNKSDVCLYVLHLSGGEYILLLLYVDDILLAASNASVLRTYVQKIVSTFRISSEGQLESYLGITIRQDAYNL